MTHEEKTRLIAEFDGWEFVGNDEDYPHGCFINSDSFIPRHYYELPYKDYNGLMPVWHKFRDLRFKSVKLQFEHSNKIDILHYELTNGNEETLFDALAEAIEGYNKTKK